MLFPIAQQTQGHSSIFVCNIPPRALSNVHWARDQENENMGWKLSHVHYI